MFGLAGQPASFPYLKEASVIASGYQRVDIWYAPIPLADHGWAAQRFREVELTETKFTSLVKAEMLMFVLIIPASFFIWSFFWNSNPLPSAQFPFAQQFWPINANMQSVWQQINSPHDNYFKHAFKLPYMAYGTAAGLLIYACMSAFRIPLLFFYGFAGGLGAFPANTLPTLLGAWLGRRFFAKKYGLQQWRRFTPVLLAGFSCGTGLVAMVSISLALIAKAVAKLPY
jgi:hypothetical protein